VFHSSFFLANRGERLFGADSSGASCLRFFWLERAIARAYVLISSSEAAF